MIISPSQLKTFEDCPRKWYLDKIEKVPRGPSKAAAELGTLIHHWIETWFVDNTVPPFDEHPKAQLLWPAWNKWVRDYKADASLVEIKFNDDDLFDLPIRGIIDLIKVTDDMVEVVDHKTTSSDKWFKDPITLKTDLQALVYSIWARHKWPGRAVRFTHHYILTNKPQDPVFLTVEFSDQELDEGIERVNEIMGRMAEYALKDHYENVFANRAACGYYGGCPFRAMCNEENPFSFIFTSPIKEKDSMSVLSMFPDKSSEFRIFIDCMPINDTAVTRLDEFAKDECRAYEKANKGVDWMAAPFNEGPRVVVAGLVNSIVQGRKDTNVNLVVDSRSPLGSLFIARLVDIPNVSLIVRGV